MAKPRRPGLRSHSAAEQRRSHSQDSSSNSSIPNTATSARKPPVTATLREKRRPEANAEQPPLKRIRRLDARFAKARASSGAEEGAGEDVAVNPAVLDTMNNGPLNGSSRPAIRPRSRIAVEIPQSSGISNQPRNWNRPLTTGRATLDPIEESPRQRQRDVPIDSVEREEPDDGSEAEHAQLPQAGSDDEDEYQEYHEQEVEGEDLDDSIDEAARDSPRRPGPRTINSLSDRGTSLRRRGALDIEDGRATLSPAFPDIQSIFTAAVDTRRLRAIFRYMGRDGWTSMGKSWDKGFSQDEPGITRIGGKLFKYLNSFRTLVRNAPKLVGAQKRDLAKQKNWFDANHGKLKKFVSEIAKLVARIREDLDLPVPNGRGADLEGREAVVRDLMNPIIPQLVRVLMSLFSLGGVNPENLNDILDEVLITQKLLVYIQAVTIWTASLWKKLYWELEQRPLKNRGIKGVQLEKLVKNQQSAWKLFDGAMHQLKQDLKDAEQQHGEAENAEYEEERIAKCQQRDEQIREARERMEVEEEEAKERRYEAVARSTQWIRSQPRPLAELWRKANERHDQVRHAQNLQPTPPLGGPFMSGARGPPPPQFHESRVLNCTPEEYEKKAWILDQITKEDGEGRTRRPTRDLIEGIAETLTMEVAEVMEEVAGFQRSARHLASERGLHVSEWAREVDVAVGRRHGRR